MTLSAVLLWTTGAAPAAAAPFAPGDLTTYAQDDWGDGSASPVTAAPILLGSGFLALYGAQGYVDVGMLGSPGSYAMLFTSASALLSYLPSSGLPAPLNATLVDPATSASGIFGGEVVGLRLNVDFSDAGYLAGALATPFGDLVIHDYAPLPLANGLTVRQFLAQANLALGGASPAYGADLATILAQQLNASFSPVRVQNPDGSFHMDAHVTQFAQDHLAVAATPVPEPATLGLLGIGLAGLIARRRRRGPLHFGARTIQITR